MSEFNPGTCDISSALLVSYAGKSLDMAAQIVKFDLDQSMSTVAYRGSLTVLDTIGLMENFPLRAEETMYIKILSSDLGTEKDLKVQVFRIDNIVPTESAGGLMYTMHFVSYVTWEASKRKIITSFQKKSVNQIVKSIFENYFSGIDAGDYLDERDKTKVNELATARYELIAEPDRNLYIQPTANMTNCLIPDYIPSKAMQYLTTVAYTPDSPSASFKFFETLDNYYFATDEFFIKNARRQDLIELFYSPASSIDPKTPLDQINRIESIEISTRGMDSAADVHGGAYTNNVLEIDLLRKVLTKNEWNYEENAGYTDMTGNPRNIDDDPHTEAFRSETFNRENARNFMVFKDYNSNGDVPGSMHTDRFIPQIVSNRVSYDHHLNKTTLQIGMKGRLDIAPGMVVNLSIQGLDAVSNTESNKTLSGKYLVHTSRHSRNDSGTLNSAFKLVKFGWSKGDVDV